MAATDVSIVRHQHGKSKVRVGRVWREGNVHHIVEWNVDISLMSNCESAFTAGDNSDIVATDTIKNTVYVLAQQCKEKLSMESFALLIGRHFLKTYPVVTGSKVSIVEKPWERETVSGLPHNHGFKQGTEMHTVEVEVDKAGTETVTAGIKDLALLKTTQSGFEGFIRDSYTILPDTRERIVASSILATWRYGSEPSCYAATFETVKSVLTGTFFGPPLSGTYSPSVQNTLYLMAKAVLEKVPEVESVYLNMPNLHFIPVNMPAIGVKFNDDVYLPTSEPHGTIEAHLSRKQTGPLRARL